VREGLEVEEEVYGDLQPRLMITDTVDGPAFDVTAHGDSSPGVRNVEIYCFHMTLMVLQRRKGLGPGFLIHDSHLFDPVDARQAGAAIELG
jgi:uncharacterized protein YydD (DUF2326 family)